MSINNNKLKMIPVAVGIFGFAIILQITANSIYGISSIKFNPNVLKALNNNNNQTNSTEGLAQNSQHQFNNIIFPNHPSNILPLSPGSPNEGPPQLAIKTIGYQGTKANTISPGEDVTLQNRLEFRIHFTNYNPVKDNQMLIKRVICQLDGVVNSLSCRTGNNNPFELSTSISIRDFIGGRDIFSLNPGTHTFSIAVETIDKGTATAEFSFHVSKTTVIDLNQ